MDGATSRDTRKGRRKFEAGFWFILGEHPRSWLIQVIGLRDSDISCEEYTVTGLIVYG